MHKEKKNKHFIQSPFYKGGLAAMRAFIKENLVYPDVALKNKVEGVVFIKYTINFKGKVINTKVITGLGHGCDEEAERLVSLFEFVVPKNRGVRIKFFKTIQIRFNLKKAESVKKTPVPPAPKTDNRVISYNVVKATPEKTKQDKPGSSGYSYTIHY